MLDFDITVLITYLQSLDPMIVLFCFLVVKRLSICTALPFTVLLCTQLTSTYLVLFN